MRDTDKDWMALATASPYWAILTEDKFRGKEITQEAQDAFFATGVTHIKEVGRRLDFAQLKNGMRVGLDFGAGVGRLSFPMSDFCEQVLAIDVAPDMLRLGAEHAEMRGVKNVSFMNFESFLQSNTRVDWINSLIVFQHIPPSTGLTILSELLPRLKSNGVISIQFVFGRSSANIVKAIRDFRYFCYDGNELTGMDYVGAGELGAIHMFDYDLNSIFTEFYKHDIEIVDTIYTNHGGHIGVIFFGRKSAAAEGANSSRCIFNSLASGAKYLKDGWSRVEDWGVWSGSTTATVRMPIGIQQALSQRATIRIKLRALPLATGDQQQVTVSIGNAEVTVDVVQHAGREFWIEVPNLPSDVEPELKFTVDRTYRIGDLVGKGKDKREAGVGLLEMVAV